MEIIKSLNWVDVLVIIIILRISYVAFQEGLSHEIFPLAGALATIVLSIRYYTQIGGLISGNLIKISPLVSNFLGFLIIAGITGLACKLLKAILDKIIHVEWHPLIERFGGFIFGLARAFMTASIVLIIMALMPLPYLQRSIRDKSATGMYIVRIGPAIYEKAARLLPAGKGDAGVINKEDIVKNLVSDKSLAPNSAKKEKKVNEWEKIGGPK